MKRSLSQKKISKERKDESNQIHRQEKIDSDSNTEISNSDQEDSDEEEELSTVPRKLYFMACNYIEENNPEKALKALNTARILIFDLAPELLKMYERSKKRKAGDQKVPPGSSLVQRDLSDDRFLLNLICIKLSSIYSNLLNFEEALSRLRESILWFPRSVEGNYLFSKHLLLVTHDQQTMNLVEFHLSKSATIGDNLLEQSKGKVTEKGREDDLNDHIEKEFSCFNLSQQLLSLILCQSGRANEAVPYLRAQNFSWRLSKEILDYNISGETCTPESLVVSRNFVSAVDDFLPGPVLTHLRQVFRPESPFWSEHEYDTMASASRSVGYFSYLYPMKERTAVCTIESLIDGLLPSVISVMPQIAEANLAEWWVHSRPHCCGHQLHFDSDETTIEGGGAPQHPIASLVMFIDGEVGGPTLITDQLLGGGLATRGWMVMPRTNRAVIFNSNYLHGVIPGKGFVPTGSGPAKRRLTLMVGFWKQIGAIQRGFDKAGPAQPYPTTIQCESENCPSKYTWTSEMTLDKATWDNFPPPSLNFVSPIELKNSVWEPIDEIYRSSIPSYSACFQGF